jgi:hypothetical protein
VKEHFSDRGKAIMQQTIDRHLEAEAEVEWQPDPAYEDHHPFLDTAKEAKEAESGPRE